MPESADSEKQGGIEKVGRKDDRHATSQHKRDGCRIGRKHWDRRGPIACLTMGRYTPYVFIRS
jgi:hypothetical protein